MTKNILDERMAKAMEINKKTDKEALESLGFKSLDEFIKAKLSA